MEERLFQTAQGPVPVWGEFAGFRADHRMLLVIRGAFPEFDQLFGLSEALPGVDVAFVHLPGMLTPFLAASTVEAFGAAFDEVLRALEHDYVVVCGVSVGGLAALSLRSPSVRTLLLLDTPLTTTDLWPLLPVFARAAGRSAAGDDWMERIFGYRDGAVETRDYGALLAALKTPTAVLLASDPLGSPREFTRTPSLVSEHDRALYRAHPERIGLRVVANSGHHLVRDGQAMVVGTLRHLTRARAS